MSELLKINVNEHTEKKGGLTYLSWAWAWAEVLKIDPRATWKPQLFDVGAGPEPFMRIGDTAMVSTTVTINGLERVCLLPVMDNRNNAVKNPDARKISDAIMRCMTKAIAMHGLGLYIYAGEDLPESDEGSLVPALEASIEQAKQARRAVLDELALDMIEEFKAGNEAAVCKLWFNDNSFKDADERSYCWGLLKTESTLRALLQANSPHRDHRPPPKVEMVSPGPGLKKIGQRVTTEETTQ